MALGTPVNSGSPTGGTTSAADVFTPSANSTIFVQAFARKVTTVPTQPTISDDAGLTWTPTVDTQYDAGSDPRVRSRLWWAPAGASPPATTITVSCTDSAGIAFAATYVTGVDTAALTNFKAGTNATGDPSATLDNTPAASSIIIYMIGAGSTVGGSFTVPSGWTALNSASVQTNTLRAGYGYSPAGAAAGPHAFSSTHNHSIVTLVELKELVTASTRRNLTLLGVG